MLCQLSMTHATERAQLICRHDQRATLADRLDVIRGKWVVWASDMATAFAPRLLSTLLSAEAAPLGIAVRAWTLRTRPLRRLLGGALFAPIAVGREASTIKARSVQGHFNGGIIGAMIRAK